MTLGLIYNSKVGSSTATTLSKKFFFIFIINFLAPSRGEQLDKGLLNILIHLKHPLMKECLYLTTSFVLCNLLGLSVLMLSLTAMASFWCACDSILGEECMITQIPLNSGTPPAMRDNTRRMFYYLSSVFVACR